jgi:hypothetical protein
MAKIYTLSHPLTNEVRYIGKSYKDLSKRLYEHLKDSIKIQNNTYKHNWIRSLQKQNLEPRIELLDEVDDVEWQYWEKFYISLFRSWGFRLINATDGGEGLDSKSASRYAKKRYKSLDERKKTGLSIKQAYERNPEKWSGKNLRRGKARTQWSGYIYIFNREGKLVDKFETIREATIKYNVPREYFIKNGIGFGPKRGAYKGYTFVVSKKIL